MYVVATQTAMGLFGVNSCNLKLHDIKLDSLDAQPKKQLSDLCIFCFVFFGSPVLTFLNYTRQTQVPDRAAIAGDFLSVCVFACLGQNASWQP